MQLVVSVAGAAIGFAVGGPAGAQAGFALASTAYGLFGPKPSGPGPGELKRPQLTLGAQIARVYGRTRRPLQLVWASDFRATEVEQGGKGAPEGPSSYTYSLDVLGWVADGANVVGLSRVWINNELVYTALDASDIDSVDASQSTSRWDTITLLDGNDTQSPWAVYEDAVGATDAPAYRGVCSIGIENLQVGGSQNVPFIEVEVLTAAASDPPTNPALERLFEISYGEIGSGQFGNANFASPITVIGEVSPEANFVTFYRYTSPSASPVAETAGVAGVGGGGITPYGGTGDREAIIFRAGGTLYGYYPGVVSYTHSTADLTLVNTLCYAFEGSVLYVCTDQGELYRYNRATGGTELATNASAEACRTIVMLDGSVYGADPFTSGDLVQWDGTTLAEIDRWALDPDSLGLICTDGTSIFDFADNAGTVVMLRFNGSTWDTVVADMGDIDAYLLPSGNQSNPVLLNGYVYLSRSDGAFDWLLMRARYRLTIYTPQPVDLQDVVDAEMSRISGLDPSDWDSSDLAGVDVTGFTAVGSAAQTLADLGDIYHFDLVPGAPMRFVLRSAGTVGSIPFNDTGAGVDEAGEPFTGLKIGNNDESPGVVGLTYPNVEQDHDVDFQSGDRLTTDGPDIRRVQTNVVLSPAEARGRAFSATVLQRSMAKTAGFGLSDAYAAAEPGDAYAVTDIDANAYNLRIKRFTYADGVKQCEWELNDISALVDELETETDYTEAITVSPAGSASLLLIDGPLLRDADNAPGFYAAITIAGDGGATLYGSIDDTAYTSLGAVTRSATTGTCTALGDWTGGWTWDETNSFTVTLEPGGASLSSSTRAAMYADERVNAALIGAHGRWELVRFREATLTGTRTYLVSGLLRGGKGTEFAIPDHAAGDSFVLLNDSGMLSVTQLAEEIGVLRYFKAVADRRAVASVEGNPFTCQSERLVPRSVVDIRADGSYLTWDRRTRLSAPATGEPPLGEASESYQVEILDDVDALVSTTIVDEPRMPFGQAVLGDELSQAISHAAIISGVLYGVWEWGTVYHDKRIVGRNIATDAGTYLSATLTNARVDAVVYVGSTAYVAATDLTPGGTTDQTYLHRVSLASSTIAATWSPTPYDQLSDLYWDGTYIWAYGRASGSLTQHNATTLAVINTYDAPDRGGISFGGSMAAGGGLFYAISDVDEVQGFDPVSLPSVDWTASLSGASAYDLVYAGSLLFVVTNTGVVVLDPTDGTVLETYTDGITSGLYVDGSDVVYELLGNTLRWLDGTTGAVSREVASPSFGSFAGVASGRLVFYSATNSSIGSTRLYDVIDSLAGYTVRVAQISETVGAGHSAEITL